MAVSRRCFVDTNINKFNIFDESYKSKITFLAKITKMPTEQSTDYIEAYLFSSHGKKYLLKNTISDPFKSNSSFLDIDMHMDEVNDFFDDFITGLDKTNVIFSIPEEKALYSVENEPNKYKTNLLTIDTSNENPGVKSETSYKNISYIDFMTYLGKSANEEVKTDYVNMFLKATRTFTSDPRPAFRFADGTTLSIQAGAHLYCQPRTANAERYTCVECGFPSKAIPQLEEYKECPDDVQEDTVFPYVPVEVINGIIEEKGIDEVFMNTVFKLKPDGIEI